MFDQFEAILMLIIAIGVGYLLCFLKYSAKIFHLQREYGQRMLVAAKGIQLARWHLEDMQKRLAEYEKES